GRRQKLLFQLLESPPNPHTGDLLPAASFLFDNSPLGMPVGKRQTQTLQVGIADEDLRLDRGDLAFAAFDAHSARSSRLWWSSTRSTGCDAIHCSISSL